MGWVRGCDGKEHEENKMGDCDRMLWRVVMEFGVHQRYLVL